MGSSSKKKKDKKKDFVKTKLKVGKAKPKPSNATSTSFQSKAIVVTQQSLRTHAPSTTSQITHTISQLSHHSPSTRKDALSHLLNLLSSCSTAEPLPVSYSVLLPALAPIILDSAVTVRSQLGILLDELTRPKDIRRAAIVPASAINMFSERFMLYIHSAMTHIHSDIRADSTKFLSWLVDVIGADALSGSREWNKTLRCWIALMGWEASSATSKNGIAKGHGSTVVFSHTGKNNVTILQHLSSLATFLKVGLLDDEETNIEGGQGLANLHPHAHLHLIPRTSNVYAHLSLFGGPVEMEAVAEDAGSRRRVFRSLFEADVRAGLSGKQKEGGEVGRKAGSIIKIINLAMKEEDGEI